MDVLFFLMCGLGIVKRCVLYINEMTRLLFSVYEHVDSQAEQNEALEFGILVHDDGDDADVGQESPGSAHHVFPAQPVLTRRVEPSLSSTLLLSPLVKNLTDPSFFSCSFKTL